MLSLFNITVIFFLAVLFIALVAIFMFRRGTLLTLSDTKSDTDRPKNSQNPFKGSMAFAFIGTIVSLLALVISIIPSLIEAGNISLLTETETPTITLTLTIEPTTEPTPQPTVEPTTELTTEPTIELTIEPTTEPTPEAVVIASNGLNLRSGPGTNYDIIRFLRNGEILNIQGRTASRDWLRVIPADPSTIGWVSAQPDFIKVNLDLNDIPTVPAPPPPLPSPTPTSTPVIDYEFEFGPNLFEPRPFTSHPVGETVRFSWQEYSLKEQQYYSLVVVRDDLPLESACIHWQTREPEIWLKLDCPPGTYTWSVGIVTDLSIGSGIKFRDDSEFDERNPFAIGIPHPDRPRDSGYDDGAADFIPPDAG